MISKRKRKLIQENRKFLVPFLISILVGFFIAGIIMTLAGFNPFNAYFGMFVGTFSNDPIRNIGRIIIQTAPLILSGLSVAFAFKTGLFNIGAEGQFYVGLYAALIAGIALGETNIPFAFMIPVIAGTFMGALWGFVPGILKAKFGVHEVVVTIMMNYIAYVIIFHSRLDILLFGEGTSKVYTKEVHESVTLRSNFLVEQFGIQQMNWGIIFAILGVIFYFIILYKTKYGYELRAVGQNKEAARYSGMKVNNRLVQSMMISGAFAGLGGVIYGIGLVTSIEVSQKFIGYGFEGITVAMIGLMLPLGIFVSALLLAFINVSRPSLLAYNFFRGEVETVPGEIVSVILAILLLIAAIQLGDRILNMLSRNKDKNTKELDSKEDIKNEHRVEQKEDYKQEEVR